MRLGAAARNGAIAGLIFAIIGELLIAYAAHRAGEAFRLGLPFIFGTVIIFTLINVVIGALIPKR